ncbi:hypothetical protein H7J07_09630 [Mycobacterium koreense]|uniref:Uncharacterized protein n=1 Tax=Mycolicibacillus koreensis TaxID=1069220 RepID=A0A7I7SF70_9MYCO|nr:hypothetical protein [Mycolicibacillus koreensis]MCV7248472.1 hypothetical protein [Mycolicibacillus koreensis]OSC33075.1 hypothetical protein B8W67_12455 [Mycolicibacillus koreensis]BBY55428.1 hypothetical protein MKOR_26790 [Mycolicibacillus koreensis]
MNTGQIAWRLADELSPRFAEVDRASAFVELGSGDDWAAINLMLTLAVRGRLALSEDLRIEVIRWLNDHAANPDAEAISALLSQVHRRG